MGMLAGRRVVVTGAASGIGRAIVEHFADQGARILAVDINAMEALKAGAWAAKAISVLSLDITAKEAPQQIIAELQSLFGGVDVLINNAGISSFIPLTETTDSDWSDILNLNLTSVFRLCRDAVPLLKDSGSGRIINMGSVMSTFGAAGLTAYTASKHGIAGLTKCLASELGPFGITANFIQPGAIRTAITLPGIAADADFERFWQQKAALGRWGEPEDIAPVAAFLASEQAGFVSGTGIVADGAATQAP